MPPVGQNRSDGSGPCTADRYARPPLASAGKNFIAVRPRSASVSISVIVLLPASSGTPLASAASSSRGGEPGRDQELRARAGDRLDLLGGVTVPAPMTIPGTSAATRSIAASAARCAG